MLLWLANIFVIIFGLFIGSFLNVVIVRYPQKKSIIKPSSHCVSCNKKIKWYDNFPVISFLILNGRCRHCGKKISIRYPVVELITAVLFLAVFVRYGWSWLIIVRDFPFVALMVAITFIDLEHRIIPDAMSLGGLALGLLTAWFVPGFGIFKAVIGGAFGFGLFYFFAFVYEKFTERSGLGGGDIKLIAMIGTFLGFSGVFCTILFSSILGSVVGVIWALSSRKKKLLQVSIPYGPFLVVGALYYYLIGDVWFRSMIPM